MLMSESLIRLLKFWDQGVINLLPDDLIRIKIPLVLFQALFQTLQKQNIDGSWGSKPSREITAYAIIALANLASLPFISELSAQIKTAIEKGRSFIISNTQVPDIEYVWIAKTTYSPINISKAYVLAGLKIRYPKYILSSSLKDLLDIPQEGLHEYTRIYSKLPRLKDFPPWRIQACVMEGYLFLKQLKRIRLDMFGRTDMKKDEYFDFIAMTFASANNLQASFLRADVLFAMMFLVLRVYQVDEYMEHIISKRFGHATERVKQIISDLVGGEVSENGSNGYTNNSTNGHMCGYVNAHTNGAKNGSNGYTRDTINGHTNGAKNGSIVNDHKAPLLDGPMQNNDLSDVHDKLKAFTVSILYHPSISAANEYDQNLLKHELRDCLLSHVIQIDDSRQFYVHREAAVNWKIPRGSYHAWARSTAASHSCAPLSLAFLRCLPKNDAGRRKSAEEQYLIQDVWMHLSNKCRMENDRASLQRDRKEKNLNSLDFPEFPQLQSDNGKDVRKSKDQISRIVSYEKECCQFAFRALQQATGKAKDPDLDALRFYYFLSEIYSDIYTMRDISCEF